MESATKLGNFDRFGKLIVSSIRANDMAGIKMLIRDPVALQDGCGCNVTNVACPRG